MRRYRAARTVLAALDRRAATAARDNRTVGANGCWCWADPVFLAEVSSKLPSHRNAVARSHFSLDFGHATLLAASHGIGSTLFQPVREFGHLLCRELLGDAKLQHGFQPVLRTDAEPTLDDAIRDATLARDCRKRLAFHHVRHHEQAVATQWQLVPELLGSQAPPGRARTTKPSLARGSPGEHDEAGSKG